MSFQQFREECENCGGEPTRYGPDGGCCDVCDGTGYVLHGSFETFFVKALGDFQDEDGEFLESGWYWWACFPGCLPDGSPCGPFKSEQDAIDDAQQE